MRGVGMRMASAAAVLFLLAETASAAYCGRPRDDGNSITVNGTIRLVEKADESWGGGKSWLELAECPLFGVVIRNDRSCSVGRQIQATGEFYYCDDESFDWDECEYDQLEATRFTCR